MRVLLILAMLLVPWSAHARRSDSVSYRYDQVWNSVVRLIRVDYGFTIQDRDKDNGFLLFDYRDHGRTYPGSLEVVRTGSGAGEQVRVTLSIPAMPSYVERMVLDRLQRKLREDFGEPLRVTPTPSAETPEEETEAPAEEAQRDGD